MRPLIQMLQWRVCQNVKVGRSPLRWLETLKCQRKERWISNVALHSYVAALVLNSSWKVAVTLFNQLFNRTSRPHWDALFQQKRLFWLLRYWVVLCCKPSVVIFPDNLFQLNDVVCLSSGCNAAMVVQFVYQEYRYLCLDNLLRVVG